MDYSLFRALLIVIIAGLCGARQLAPPAKLVDDKAPHGGIFKGGCIKPADAEKMNAQGLLNHTAGHVDPKEVHKKGILVVCPLSDTNVKEPVVPEKENVHPHHLESQDHSVKHGLTGHLHHPGDESVQRVHESIIDPALAMASSMSRMAPKVQEISKDEVLKVVEKGKHTNSNKIAGIAKKISDEHKPAVVKKQEDKQTKSIKEEHKEKKDIKVVPGHHDKSKSLKKVVEKVLPLPAKKKNKKEVQKIVRKEDTVSKTGLEKRPKRRVHRNAAADIPEGKCQLKYSHAEDNTMKVGAARKLDTEGGMVNTNALGMKRMIREIIPPKAPSQNKRLALKETSMNAKKKKVKTPVSPNKGGKVKSVKKMIRNNKKEKKGKKVAKLVVDEKCINCHMDRILH